MDLREHGHNRRWRFRQPSVLPGFGLALGVTLFWLVLIILIPLSGLIWRSSGLGWSQFMTLALDTRTLNALRISFGTAFVAAIVNLIFGVILAWVLVRYRFPGKRVIDAMVDLPFALPTAVAGIALATLYAPNGWIGALLAPLGIKIAFTPVGIVIALIFVGLPFVVRTVQPIME
ncbi:MAG: molybdate ABC transporter permease subunit, partial [Ensifer adhaerens]